MIDPNISNKVAIVTGANSGIGASIARELAAQGAKIIIHYLKDASFSSDESTFEHTTEGERAAQKVAKTIENLPGEAEIIDGDLSKSETIEEIFNFAEQTFGPVEILVNNAAHCELPDTIKNLPEGLVERHFKINTEAPVLLIKK